MKVFGAIDKLLKRAEPLFPASLRRRAIDAAAAFVTERLNGEDGLGAIYPAMANSVLMFDALGYPPDHLISSRRVESIERLLVVSEDEAYCQPCLSPVWDTALAAHALMETGGDAGAAPVRAALDWLTPLQVLDVKGDWAVRRPDVRPGGWAFQYANPHYPDLDDTAVVAMAMDRADRGGLSASADAHAGGDCAGARMDRGIAKPERRVGRFRRRQHLSLSQPHSVRRSWRAARSADRRRHRALRLHARPARRDARDERRFGARDRRPAQDQETDGSWFGRWGMNYIYGTWSALCALAVVGQDPQIGADAPGRRWLLRIQNDDGGWGESGSQLQA